MIPRCVKPLVDVIQDLQLCANEMINGTSLGPEFPLGSRYSVLIQGPPSVLVSMSHMQIFPPSYSVHAPATRPRLVGCFSIQFHLRLGLDRVGAVRS